MDGGNEHKVAIFFFSKPFVPRQKH